MLILYCVILGSLVSFMQAKDCSKQQCGENEVYRSKGGCETTCEGEVKCTTKPGCFCKKGHRRRKGLISECVRQEDCDDCPSGEHYDGGGDCSNNNCLDYYKRPVTCNLMLSYKCFCNEGLIREQRDDKGKCIPPNECPGQKCRDDEEYYDCKPDCTNRCGYKPGDLCFAICNIGCFCKQGLVINKDGKCIPPDQCESHVPCGKNEVYNECGTQCPKTCDNYKTPVPYCILSCKSGCFCKDDFVRNKDGKCVRPSECDNKRCPINEEHLQCGLMCEDCGIQCPGISCPPGGKCFCKRDFSRLNGICIPTEDCPKRAEADAKAEVIIIYEEGVE